MKKIQCITFKITYYSKQEAEERTEQINKKGATKNGKSVQMRAYQCSACGYWHITSMNKSLHDKIIDTKLRKKKKRLKLETDYWEQKLKK